MGIMWQQKLNGTATFTKIIRVKNMDTGRFGKEQKEQSILGTGYKYKVEVKKHFRRKSIFLEV